jgi:hypothetical protein
MDKTQIQARMREILGEYNELKEKLDAELGVIKVKAFEEKQRSRLDSFKTLYTVEITVTGEVRPVDWSEIEKNVFSEGNLRHAGTEGYLLGYRQVDGFAGLGCTYYHGNKDVTFAYDEVDAKRYLERDAKRKELAPRGKQ